MQKLSQFKLEIFLSIFFNFLFLKYSACLLVYSIIELKMMNISEHMIQLHCNTCLFGVRL